MIENNIFLSHIISWQQEINLMISDYFDLLQEGNATAHFTILAISFLYGLIHAMGPGHGKMVIASYFLAKDSNRVEAFKAGFLTAIIHTISALLITGILYVFFQNTISGYFQSINQNMYKVSAVFIILIACFLLYESLHDRDKKEEMQPLKNKNILTIALSIGIVPCPGVMTIVLYAMILGYLTLGVFSAVTMSIGMGLTISIAAILASSIKSTSHAKYKKGIEILTFVGIGVLFLLGGSLLV
jgi:nickel/cobalt exporter